MRIFSDLLIVFAVCIAVMVVILLVQAVLSAVGGAEQSFIDFMVKTNRTGKLSWFMDTKEPLKDLTTAIEVGLIIALVAMVIAAFMYSRKR